LGVDDNSFRIIALGGLGEIGMNCLAVEARGRLLLIDCGAMFSSEGLGIDLILPGFDFLAERRGDIEGLVLTHAHEDHVAGVPYLLREIDVPVYGGAYSLGLLAGKMADVSPTPKLIPRKLNQESRIELGPFSLETFPMPHSTVENTGLIIDTPGGRILHTGDFKLQLKGPDKGRQVLARLKAAAGIPVDLMMADSTGSEEDEIAGEETEVAAAIDKLIQDAAGRVFVAIFSSNVKRLQLLLEIAKKHDRRVALCGRSVQTHVGVSTKIGALSIPSDLMVPQENAMETDRRRSLAVVSGTQGETRSALGKLSENAHHLLKIEKDDLVILSSRFIPGNELAIGRMIDRLSRLGARVVHRGIRSDIHVSGHASKREILQAIKTVGPRCFMPVHGTYRHLVACAALAKEAGVDHIQVASDGQIAQCDPGGLFIKNGFASVRRTYIDGGGGLDENAMKDRRILGSHGVLVVSFSKSGASGVLGSVEVIARGVTRDEAVPWLTSEVRKKVTSILGEMDPSDRANPDKCSDLIRSQLRKFLSKLISREPYVLVSVLPD
jgi:ribonuclease J